MTGRRAMRHGPEHPWFDNRDAPLIVMTLPESFRDDELRAALDAVERWLLDEVDAPFGFVVDVHGAMNITSVQRRMMAESEKRYAAVDVHYNGAQALVLPTPIARGVLTAVYWLSPPVYPVHTFSHLPEARAWVRAELEVACREFPDGPHWRRREGWTADYVSRRAG